MNERVKELELEAGDSKKYKVEAIWDSVVYASKSESGWLADLYYLVMWKGYPEEENIWESSSTIQHLKKLINFFHKNHPEKPTATSLPIDFALPIARPTVRPTLLKQK